MSAYATCMQVPRGVYKVTESSELELQTVVCCPTWVLESILRNLESSNPSHLLCPLSSLLLRIPKLWTGINSWELSSYVKEILLEKYTHWDQEAVILNTFSQTLGQTRKCDKVWGRRLLGSPEYGRSITFFAQRGSHYWMQLDESYGFAYWR